MRTNKFIISILLLIAHQFNGQSLSDLVKEAESLYQETKAVLVFPRNQSFIPHQYLLSKIDSVKNTYLWEKELKSLESKQYAKDIGLVFKANAHYNFRTAFNEETNNFNIGRVRAELEWNILRSGYLHNRTKSKRLLHEREILEYERLQKERELKRRQFRIDYTYAINRETISLFKKFLSFENKYFDYLNRLYFKKYIKRERLIKVGQQINILENQLHGLEIQNKILKDSVSVSYFSIKSLPFLQLHLDSLSLNYNKSSIKLKEKNIELQHKAINNLNLSFYVQESFNYLKNGHRFFPSVGVRFRAPIRFNYRRSIIETKKKMVTAREIDKSVGKHNRFITLTSGYNEKLKDLHNQYKSWQVLEERIRILTILKSELNYEETGTLLLELLEEKFKVLENLLQLKRQLYTTLSHLYEITDSSMAHNLTALVQFKDFTSQKKLAIQKSLKYSIDFQIRFLKVKGCKEVEVLKRDLELQKALQKANIPFKKVEKITSQIVEKAILSELSQIQLKP